MSDCFRYLEHAFRDGQRVEIRHQHDGHWQSGLFDDLGKCRRAIEERLPHGALYSSLNQPDRSLVALNRFGTRPLTNDDITHIRRIPFDFDPVRPPGTSSTDAELGRAHRVRDAVVTAMRAAGWPLPAFAMSGNGAHALWRTHLHPDDALRRGLAILYAAVQRLFGELCAECGVIFDTTVRNPGRIWRLYGSTNRKGEPTPERPHRTATVVFPPGGWHCVTPRQVNRLIDLWTPAVIAERHAAPSGKPAAPLCGRGDYATLDVVAWFRSHGAYRKALQPDHVHGVWCPWHTEHSSQAGPSETVIFEARGHWPGFHCHHAHCQGRGIRDVLALWGDADAFCARPFQGGRSHA